MRSWSLPQSCTPRVVWVILQGKTCVRDFYTGDRYKASSISMGYIGIHNAMVVPTGDQHWHTDAAHPRAVLRNPARDEPAR